MAGQKSLCLVVGAVLLIALLIYLFSSKKQGFTTKKEVEPYMAAGAIDHLDSLDSRYELIESPDEAVPAEHFADLVDSGDQAAIVRQPTDADIKPLERLERLQGKSMLPLTAAHIPQYNIDVANPSTYAFATQAPRVVLKNRLYMQADPFRGDIAIRYTPDVPLISTSSYGRDSFRGDGYFSDTFTALHSKLVGRSFKNLPLKVATQGTIADYVSADE